MVLLLSSPLQSSGKANLVGAVLRTAAMACSRSSSPNCGQNETRPYQRGDILVLLQLLYLPVHFLTPTVGDFAPKPTV